VSALLADAIATLVPDRTRPRDQPGAGRRLRSSSTPSGDPLDQTIAPEPARVQVRRYA
jgi:hypothetical protein